MKVRIIKASEPTYWYANKIGKVFSVHNDPHPIHGYLTIKKEANPFCRGFIGKDDCEVVQP